MQISLLLMQQIAQLFLILLMGYAVVKTGLLKASDSKGWNTADRRKIFCWNEKK